MIDEKDFLKYKLEIERRFFEIEKKLLLLEHQLEKAVSGQVGANVEMSDEEQKKIEEEALRQAKTFAEWTEDADTIAKLGIGIKTT